MMFLTRKWASKFTAGAFVAAAALVILPTPAQAVQSCSTSQEVCRDTRANYSAGTLTFRTISSSQTDPNFTKYWSVNKGVTGEVICSGRMSFNATRSCNLQGYRGQVTATFVKGPYTLVTVSIQ